MKHVVGLLIVGLLSTMMVAHGPLRAYPALPPKAPENLRGSAPSPPGIKPADRLSKWKGHWNVEFANGVRQVHELRSDYTATVKARNWSSRGRVQFQFDGKSVTITYRDNRVERWTPVGNQMVVEHWFPASRLPKTAPVLGIGERAK